uniref:YadA-like family protein n=2 Tax=unclassified Burkholderia TaxID=2613784 RepID=UPI002ABDBE18
LSTSTSTGIGSLSTGLSTTNSTVASLSTGVTNLGDQVNQLSTTINNNTTRTANNNGVAADMNGTGNDRPTVTAGSNSVAIGANSNDGGRSNVVSVGSDTQQRQITNVAPGTQGTDAVNLNQLNDSLSQSNRYTDQRVNEVSTQVNQVAKAAYAGVAAATALTMIPDVDLGKTIAVGIGAGTYKGQQAVAFGASVRFTQNIKGRLGAGYSSQGTSVGVGAAYQW